MSKLTEATRLIIASCLISSIAIQIKNIGSPALVWPALDNLPAVCRLLDPTCLLEDFFTNSSIEMNPRLPYVYMVSWMTGILGSGLGSGLAVMKGLILAVLPCLMAAFILSSVAVQKSGQNTFTLNSIKFQEISLFALCIPVITFVLSGFLGDYLSIAWWRPIGFEATSGNTALLLALLGYLFMFFNKQIIGVITILIAGIIHPVMCFYTSIFCSILLVKFSFKNSNLRMVIAAISSSVIAALCVGYIFKGSSLGAVEFINIYAIEAHPFHYLPSQFGRLANISQIASFGIVFFGLIILTIILWLQDKKIWINSLIATAMYGIAIALQYFLVEIRGVKFIAALGPSRFTMFGPWFLYIFFIYALCEIKTTNFFPFNYLILSKFLKLATGTKYILLYGLIALILCIVNIVNSNKYEKFDQDMLLLFEFAIKESDSGDVFSLPYGKPIAEFPLITNRAIFIGNGFPFSEKYMQEYAERHSMVYGGSAAIKGFPGSWAGEKYANFYRSLAPEDFINIERVFPLNWVVIESSYSDKFEDCKSSLTSNKYKIFSLNALRRCAP